MKNKLKKIWDLALQYQDKRDDVGHARIVTNYTLRLCEIENVEKYIAVPAAILHDVGWSQMTEEERFSIFEPDRKPEKEHEMRLKHQEESVKLAKMILKEADYPADFTKLILKIISKHDTGKIFFSNEDGAMRDADKLWWFSKPGFEADIRRRGYSFEQYYEKLKQHINKNNFFYFESSRNIAKEELEQRKSEFCS